MDKYGTTSKLSEVNFWNENFQTQTNFLPQDSRSSQNTIHVKKSNNNNNQHYNTAIQYRQRENIQCYLITYHIQINVVSLAIDHRHRCSKTTKLVEKVNQTRTISFAFLSIIYELHLLVYVPEQERQF